MNKEWSELNKQMQLQLKKKESFSDGIDTLFLLRQKLMKQIERFKSELTKKDFCTVLFKNANGYHSKTIAYSLWHIFRIEDIVANTLIADKQQVFFVENYDKRIGSAIITTGNEITNDELAEFSERLNIDELYNYIYAVDKAAMDIVGGLTFEDMKTKISDERKNKLLSLNVVAEEEAAAWLIDYWCGKDIRGLVQMPLSRHWIMHIEASVRIADKINAMKNKENL